MNIFEIFRNKSWLKKPHKWWDLSIQGMDIKTKTGGCSDRLFSGSGVVFKNIYFIVKYGERTNMNVKILSMRTVNAILEVAEIKKQSKDE